MTTVFLTKYSLKTGRIEKRDAEIDDGYAHVKRAGSYPSCYSPSVFAFDEVTARHKAISARAKKIASLKKQIARLEALEFTISEA